MRPLSSPAVGCAADIAKDAFSEGDLEILSMRSGLDRFVPKSWYGKAKLVGPTVCAAQGKASSGNMAATDGLGEFVRLLAERIATREPGTIEPGIQSWRLREAVRSDGLKAVAIQGRFP